MEQTDNDPGRQATAWLVNLDEDPENEVLRGDFLDWLDASPTHLGAWKETVAVSSLIARAGPALSALPALPAASARHGWLGRRPSVKAVASMGMAFSLAWIVAPDLIVALQADASTGTAEIRRVELEDGSRAYLGPDSAIAFSNGAQGRSLNLLRGEAYFDVAHDRSRPFEVRAGNSRVTVLGTAFSVRRGDRGAEVEVERGKVAVSRSRRGSSRPVILAAGQHLSADMVMPGAIRPDRVASWREGVAIVDDLPVSEVIDRIRPWYNGIIVTRGPRLASRRVSGVYDLGDPDQALQALTRAHDVSVSHISPWLRIVTVD